MSSPLLHITLQVHRCFLVLNEGNNRHGSGTMDLELEVVKGQVEAVRIGLSGGGSSELCCSDQDIQALTDSVQGLEFGPTLPGGVFQRLNQDQRISLATKQFFTDCIYTMTHKFT